MLNNGSSDETGSLVEEFARTHKFCRLIAIAAGDKANAWNVFVHELGIEADLFFFLDGDCQVARNAFDALERCIADTLVANAATALPSPKLAPRSRAEMLRDGGLAGNLYCLPRRFVARLRQSNVRLPFGLIGDDSLLGALAYWDLDPQSSWDTRRINVCREAEFSYAPLSPFSLRDIRLRYRRKIRYSLRYFQTELMRRPLKECGLSAIPRNVEDLYLTNFSSVRVRWRGLDTLFDFVAAARIRKCIARQRS